MHVPCQSRHGFLEAVAELRFDREKACFCEIFPLWPEWPVGMNGRPLERFAPGGAVAGDHGVGRFAPPARTA